MARRGENIYKRKDGRWEGRYKSGYNDKGKAKYRSVYGHSYAEVREKLVPLKASAHVPTFACRQTVKELFNEWFIAIKLHVKPSTYANYQMKVKKHIIPAFGGLRYDTLTVKMLNTFIDDKVRSGLSAKYMEHGTFLLMLHFLNLQKKKNRCFLLYSRKNFADICFLISAGHLFVFCLVFIQVCVSERYAVSCGAI